MTLKGILAGVGGALLSLYVVENTEAPWSGLVCFLIGTVTLALALRYKFEVEE